MDMNASLHSSALASPARNFERSGRADFIWRLVAVVVFAALIAKWTWIFIAPKDAALPTTSAWKKTSDADQLFGAVTATDAISTGSLGNIQLVGVFAHPTEGFAVLSIEGKQVGVSLGELVMAGARLVETKADYVLVERGSFKSRIDLAAAKPSSGIVPAGEPTIGSVNNVNAQKIAPLQPEMSSQVNQLSPEQRAAMQQELQHFRRRN